MDIFFQLEDDQESRDENSNPKAKKWEIKNIIKQVANILYADRSERFKSAQPIVGANIPIVRVKDRLSGIRCDLNTCTRMGVVNTSWVRFCVDHHPNIRNLLILVKTISKRQGLTGSGRGDHLTSYCLTVLVIFFLQTKGVLHSVSTLQDVPDLPELQISGYNFSFCRNKSLLPTLHKSETISLAQLLQDFFSYMAEFTFGNKAVCPFVGEPVLLYNLRNGNFLHPRLEGCATGKSKDRLKTENAMVVQDPFELRRNIAANVSPKRLSFVVKTFEAAAKLLKDGKVQEVGGRKLLAQLLTPDLVSRDGEGHKELWLVTDDDARVPSASRAAHS